MSKEHFHDILSNVNYRVDYATHKLVPQVELVFVNAHPEYMVKTKGKSQYITKGHGITETRIHCSLQQINTIIGELQLTAAKLQQFEHMGNALNEVISEVIKMQKKDQDNPKAP